MKSTLAENLENPILIGDKLFDITSEFLAKLYLLLTGPIEEVEFV